MAINPPQKNGGMDLDSILPFLMLLSPMLEMRSPGSGLGLSSGILQYQRGRQEKRQRESMSLLQLLSEVDEDQLATAQGALIDAGYDPGLVKAMGKASRGMVDPARKAERALSQLVEDPNLGLIPRRTQIDVQARQQQSQQEQAVEGQRFERGQTANLAGEARTALFTMSQNPDPRVRAQAVALARRLAGGEDPQAILGEATAIAQQAGEFAAGREQQTRQQVFRTQRVGELEKEVASAVPGARPRIIRLAKEQGLNPVPYLQQLDQNIRESQLRLRALARQAAGDKSSGLTPVQIDAIWQRSLSQASFEVLGKRAGGVSFVASADGTLIPQIGAGQPPLTPDEIDRIQARAEEVYSDRVARATGQTRPPKPPAPPKSSVPMTRGERERREAARQRGKQNADPLGIR